MLLNVARKYFPEYKEVLAVAGGYKPRKFVGEIRVKVCPDTFNPSAQGDFAYTSAFVWDGENLSKGPGYSYDTMITERVNPFERMVDVPKGTRVWIVTYDGQWGGFWSRVFVFVHPDELPEPLKMLTEG